MAYLLYYVKRISPGFLDRLARITRRKKKPAPIDVIVPAPMEKRDAA
jgi:hypothetical protein